MRVSVVGVTGDELANFDLPGPTTVAELKCSLFKIAGVPPHKVCLLHQGQQLLPEATLSDSSVSDGAVLTAVILTLPGRIVTASSDTSAKLWDVELGICIHTLAGHAGAVLAVAVSADGRRVVTGHSSRDCSGNTVALCKLWSVVTGECLRSMTHASMVRAVAISSDGGSLLTVDAAFFAAKLWTRVAEEPQLGRIEDPGENESCVLLAEHQAKVTSVKFSPDETLVITASVDGTARVWSVASCACMFTLRGHTGAVLVASFSSDGSLILTSSQDQSAQLCTATGDSVQVFRGHGAAVCTAVLSEDKALVATGSVDGTAKIWDAGTGQCLHTLLHGKTLSSVVFSLDGRSLLSAGHCNTAQLWNVETGACVRSFVGHRDAVTNATFMANGVLVATASHDGTLRVWSVETGEVVHACEGHTGMLNSMAIAPLPE